MPSTVSFQPRYRVLIITCIGTYDPLVAQQVAQAYMQQPEFDPSHDQIIDLSQVTETTADFEQIEQLAARMVQQMRNVTRKRCVIIAQSELVFGLARRYQQLTQGRLPYPVEIVRSDVQALQFLGLSGVSMADLVHE